MNYIARLLAVEVNFFRLLLLRCFTWFETDVSGLQPKFFCSRRPVERGGDASEIGVIVLYLFLFYSKSLCITLPVFICMALNIL